jgi:hypothetical protein
LKKYGQTDTQDSNYAPNGDKFDAPYYNDSIERFDTTFKDRKARQRERRDQFLKLRAEFTDTFDSRNSFQPLADSIDDGSLSPPRYISKSRNRRMRR